MPWYIVTQHEAIFGSVVVYTNHSHLFLHADRLSFAASYEGQRNVVIHPTHVTEVKQLGSDCTDAKVHDDIHPTIILTVNNWIYRMILYISYHNQEEKCSGIRRWKKQTKKKIS